MPKRNAKPGFPPEASDRSDRAVSTFLVRSRSVARWHGWTVGVASLAAVLGTALVPGLGATPAGAASNSVTVVTGHSGTTAPSLGVPAAAGTAKISPTYVAYNPSNGDTAVASTVAGSVFVYLIAGGSGTEANEYNIQTAPNPSPAFGSLTSGDAYIVAGTGTAGLIAQPGNNQFGNSTTAVATANPISPTSVAFDPHGNLLIAGENGTVSAIQVVAQTTGTFYGVSMTAGDLYTVADVGVSGAPASAIGMGDVAAPANGMSVDPSGNIVVGDGGGVEFVNEQATGSLTLYGQSIAAQSAAVIAGNPEGSTDCGAGATNDPASSQYFQSAAPYIDSSDNVYFSDNEPGPASGCDWVLPAQSGTLDGMSVTAGNVYKLAGNGGTTATTDGTAGVDANVAGTSEMALDNAGNVVLAVSGAATGTSPALQVLAESTATYYGVSMTAGDIYTVAGGPSHTLATLSGPTSVLNNGSGNLLFTDGSASSANLDEFSGAPTGASLVPVVSNVSPSAGPAAGGTSVTLTGTNLTGATAVHFGTNAGTSISGVTATSLTVIAPSGTGTVDVTVTTPNGTSAVNAPSDHYTYNAPPTVTAVSPTSGPAAGTNTVTVTGTGFTGASAVDFGPANPGTSIDVLSSTSLTVSAPSGTGTVDVTVTTPNGTSAVNAPSDHYTYTGAPTVTAVSPNNGSQAGTNTVTLTGTGFVSGSTSVEFGANAGTSVDVTSSTSLTVVVPAGTGTVSVTASTTGGGASAPLANAYTYNAPPTVTAVSPNNGPAAGTNTVTLTGSGFIAETPPVTRVDFGSNAGTSVNVTSSTSLSVVVPTGTGTVNVTVTTPNGTSAVNAPSDHYTYNVAPTVTAVSPNNGPQGGTNTVTLTGSGFVSGSTSVAFGANAGTSVNVTSSTSLSVVVPAGSGTVSVTVSTTGGGASTPLANAYTYNAPPTVTNVSPTSGPAAGTNTVTVTGTGFIGASAVDFGPANPGTSIDVVSSTQITVSAPSGTGTVDVTVTTPNGTSAVNAPSDHYTYNAAPTVTAVSPNNGPQGGTNTVTLTGSGFVSGSTSVDFGSAAGTSVDVTSSTSLSVVVPAGTGTVSVTVSTTGGGASTPLANAYTYNAPPTVTNVSPNNGPQGGTNTVTLTGSGFVSGSTSVAFGSNAGTSVNVTSSTSLSVVVPAGTGTVSVTVSTTAGGSSTPLANAYTYNVPPTVTNVSPNNGPQGGTNTVTLTGSGFVSGSTSVDFGSTAGTSVNVTSSTSLTVVVPAGTGTVSVTVSTTAGGSSTPLANAYTYNGSVAPGGTVSLGKATALVGNYPENVSGTAWVNDTTVTLNECATTTYSAATCDAANQTSGVTLGTGRAAGTFKDAVIHLAVGVIDTNGDTCGVAGATTCYIVVVGNTTDSSASGALGFTLQSITVKKTTAVLGNYLDAVTASGFPIGDTVVAQECDASVSVPTTSSTHCDATTQISGTAGASGKVTFSPTGVTLVVGSAYADSASGTCSVGGSCALGVTDSENAAIGLSEAVAFATPSFTLKTTTNVLGNFVDAVKAVNFPIGDTVVAQECDASVSVPTTSSTHCDSTTQISGTTGASGKVTFTSAGVKLVVGSAYSDTASGTCEQGGSCAVGVTDSDNAALGSSVAVTFAAGPTIVLKETTGVLGNYVDAVKAAGFPIGDTVVAQECDSSVVIPTSVATDCDSATQITGTAGAKGAVVFSPATGVKLLVGEDFSDSASGACSFGGTCEIVVSDSGNPGIGTDEAVTFAVPTVTLMENSNVAANYVDKVTATKFAVGDTVVAQECDSSVTSATLASHCDSATQITGTVSAAGGVAFSPTGVKVLVGTAYGTDGTDSAGGSCPAGGSCDIVVNDSTTGAYVAVPVGLAS